MNRSGIVRGGILGLGGVGHLGVMIAKAMGHHVTVISSSDKKREEAMEHQHADAYLVSSDEAAMVVDSLDYILDTVPALHPLDLYISRLCDEVFMRDRIEVSYCIVFLGRGTLTVFQCFSCVLFVVLH
ncbi:hypothetical protein SASPL_134801 [Salvia splendens]|uniref:Alcohol dehydrogenase-like C-terminal domain-containing protein n=1 Tax=Salvia splendens TaxID=180675 RepID=A0A8X8WXJ2_SALSN|nr:hypothetical protein SASPL_134801 [Salvia splendens]